MNRRKFNTTAFIGLFGLNTSPALLAQSLNEINHGTHTQLRDREGMLLKLYQKQYATKDKDQAQYILTFDVFKQNKTLTERIYQLVDERGRKHDIFMTPINHNQLQAVFNHRTYA